MTKKDFLHHKGFLGGVEISVEDGCLNGKLLFIKDLVTYESANPQSAQN
jgi:hypothetical protein